MNEKVKRLIAAAVEEANPFTWPKNKHGEDIEQRPGGNPPGSAKHKKENERWEKFAEYLLSDPLILEAAGLVKKEGDEIFQNLPDLSHVDDAAKMAHINEMLAITCKPLIATFYMLGLKEHITGTIENNGDWFELSLKKLPAPPSQVKK